MELREVIKLYQGKKIKIGCKHGSAFLFIGTCQNNTDTVMKKLSIGYDDRCRVKIENMKDRFNNYDNFIKYNLNMYDENYKIFVKNAQQDLKRLRDKLATLKMRYDEKYIDVKKCIADISHRNKMLEKRKASYKSEREKLKKHYEAEKLSLEKDIFALEEHLFNFHNFAECKVVEDYASTDPDFKGRILLIDAWETGKLWLESEAEKDKNLQWLIETCY